MLKKNYEFRTVLSKGKYYTGKYVEAFIKKNAKKENFLGIAIGVKIAKSVRRNHIKRLLRENYQKVEEKLKDGYSIVFLWKKREDVKEATFDHIKKDIYFIFDKAGLFEEKNEENNDLYD